VRGCGPRQPNKCHMRCEFVQALGALAEICLA